MAVVPSVFGFHPEDSLVMMLVGSAGRPMFARVDLPTTSEEAEAACTELVQAARVNEGEAVALIAYTDDERGAYIALIQAAGELGDLGLTLLFGLRADGRRWFRVVPGPEDHEGVPYDLESHPITVASVLEGQVTHRTREGLAQSLLPRDPELVDHVAEACAALAPLPRAGEALCGEAHWLDRWVTDRLRAGGAADEVDAEELARVVRALGDTELHEVASVTMSRDNAVQHVRLWTDVVVRCPLDLLAPAAALLALAAWLEGHGALSWCAIDRALQSDPDCRLAMTVARVLEAALPPTAWEPGDRRMLSLLSG